MTDQMESIEFGSLKESIAFRNAWRKVRYMHFGDLMRKAHDAGIEAASKLKEDDPPNWAWIDVSPATSSFARYLVKQDQWTYDKHSRVLRSDLMLGVYAHAYAEVLRADEMLQEAKINIFVVS